MTIAASGSISLSTVLAEHGGSTPISMSSYLRGSASNLVHSTNTAIPATTPLSLSAFRGTSRFGYYPTVIGLSGTVAANNRQFGVNVAGGVGSLLYNAKYKGYTIGWILWNEYDLIFGVSLAASNVPQSTITSISTSKGTYTSLSYNPNFYGYSVWNVAGVSSSPFSAVGTTDTSIVIR